MGRRQVTLSLATFRAFEREIASNFKDRALIRRPGDAAKKLLAAVRDLPLTVGAVRIPPPESEHRFHATRKWRFDFAWPAHKVALEVQGGIFTGGRHTRGAALLREHEKLNAAAIAGWRVLFCTPAQVRNGEATKLIALAIVQGYDDD